MLARGAGGSPGTATRRGIPVGPPDRARVPAVSARRKEPLAAIGLEPGYAGSGRHLEPLQHPSRARITPHPSGLSVGDPELHEDRFCQ